MPKTITVHDTRPEVSNKPKTCPPWNVILVNDDVHTPEYVIKMLTAIFGHTKEQGWQMAEKVHTEGRAVVGTFHKELAELKQEQIHAFGKDDLAVGMGIKCEGSMTSEIEPAW